MIEFIIKHEATKFKKFKIPELSLHDGRRRWFMLIVPFVIVCSSYLVWMAYHPPTVYLIIIISFLWGLKRKALA